MDAAIVNAAKATAAKAEEDKAGLIEESKKLAAWTAVDRHLRPEHKVRITACPVFSRGLITVWLRSSALDQVCCPSV
jgi:hypothetical protein